MPLNERSLRLMSMALVTALILLVATHIMLKPSAGKFLAGPALPAKASSFELNRGSDTWKFRRNGYRWELSEPFSYRADSASIDAFLGLLPDAAISETLSSSGKADAEFGLGGEGSLRIRVCDDMGRSLLEFASGKPGPEPDSFFCLLKGKEVRLVSGLSRSLLGRGFWEWLDRTAAPLPGGPEYADIKRHGAPAVRVLQEQGIWKFSVAGSPAVALSTASAADFLLALVPGLEAEALAPYEPLDGKDTEVVLELKAAGPALPYVFNIGKASGGYRRAVKAGEAKVSYLLSADKLDALLRLRANPK